MTRLIGARCKHRKVLSRGVLIARILLGNIDGFNLYLVYGRNEPMGISQKKYLFGSDGDSVISRFFYYLLEILVYRADLF